MRQWTRARRQELCGSCREPVVKGAPVLELTGVRDRATLIRCERCGTALTGEGPPADLGQPEPSEPPRSSFTMPKHLVRTWQDVRAKAAGDG